MPRKGYMPEQIIGKLREVDVLVQQGHAVREAVRRIGVQCSYCQPIGSFARYTCRTQTD